MIEPTLQDVQAISQTIDSRSKLYREALVFKADYFTAHFETMPPELQKDFITLRDAYRNDEDGETTADPSTQDYWRRAVKRFHPDSIGDDSKVPFFQEAIELRRKNDLPSLQILVLQDMAAEIHSLGESDRQFLLSEYQVMLDIADNIWDMEAKTAFAAAELFAMSDQMFRLEIEGACRFMTNEIHQRGLKEGRTPHLIEG